MPKQFEYITSYLVDRKDGDYLLRFERSKEYIHLSEMGSQGWELCAVDAVTSSQAHYYIFKRELETSTRENC